jgi:hypothetical protein
LLKIAIGIVIGIAAWVPLSLAEPRDIPFQAAILGILGTLIGAIFVIVGLVQWLRQPSPRPRLNRAEGDPLPGSLAKQGQHSDHKACPPVRLGHT